MAKTITMDSDDSATTIVFLNGKPLRYWIAAEEGEQGWVEIIDHNALSEQIENALETGLEPPQEMELFPTVRIEGNVEFKTK